MKTYLELINKAVKEAGVDLDPLSSSDFANPPNKMHSRFKDWIYDAWKEIQMERNEWEFKTKRATINILPKILVQNGDRSVAPPVDSEFIGNDTGTTFTVKAVDLHSGAWASATAEATLDILSLDGEYKFNEYFDEVSPTPANLDVFRVKGWGRYNLDSLVSDLSEPDISTFYIQDSGGSTYQTNNDSANLEKLIYVPWPSWSNYYEEALGGRGIPRYFTTTPDGLYDFWPRLDKEYTLHFTYLAQPSTLSAYTDTLSGIPEEYEDIVVWKAVIFYAEFDRAMDVLQRANKRYLFYKFRMERNEMPVVAFGPCKYDER